MLDTKRPRGGRFLNLSNTPRRAHWFEYAGRTGPRYFGKYSKQQEADVADFLGKAKGESERAIQKRLLLFSRSYSIYGCTYRTKCYWCTKITANQQKIIGGIDIIVEKLGCPPTCIVVVFIQLRIVQSNNNR